MALSTVGKLTELVSLNLESTEIADEGLAQLKELVHLEALSLADTKVEGSGLQHLADLKNLKELKKNRGEKPGDPNGAAHQASPQIDEGVDCSGSYPTR